MVFGCGCRARGAGAERLPEEKDIQLVALQECNSQMLQVRMTASPPLKYAVYKASSDVLLYNLLAADEQM